MKPILIIAMLSWCLPAQVKITQQGNEKVSVEIDGKPFTEFFVGPETKKPYLAPLRAATGTIVTRQFPMKEDVPGEAHDHPHHRGLWFTHGDVNGYDFWGNEDSQQGANKGKGKVVLVKINKVSSGKSSGTIDATFDWKIPSGQILLMETAADDLLLRPAVSHDRFRHHTLAGREREVRRYQGRHVRDPAGGTRSRRSSRRTFPNRSGPGNW